jgi:hypothetical protein
MKNIVFTILIFCTFLNIHATESKSCLEELYKNRFHIADIIEPCKNGLGLDCSLAVFDSFKIYAREPITRWQKDEYYLWDAFFKVCWSTPALQKIKSIVLDDSILTKILVSALTHPDYKQIESKAYDLLVIRASFQQLKSAHKLIEKSVQQSSLNQQQKNLLIGLSCSENDSCKYLLADTTLPVFIKVRLGDTLAESKLLMEFDTTKNFKKKEMLTFALSNAGTRKCIRHLIENFNKPVFKIDKYGCINKSLRLTIIESFQKYFPREVLFNETWLNMSGSNFVPDNIISDTTHIKKYLKEVTDFFYLSYNLKPIDPEPEPILITKPDCGEPFTQFDK